MTGLYNKVETSFKTAMKGQEPVNNLIWWWGAIGYLSAYLVSNIIKTNGSAFFDIALSLLMIIYFSWHFYVLKKCAPKKPKLSKEEKKRLKEEARKELGKKILRKLFLQESITRWDPVFITLVIDAYCITNFVGYLIR